MVMPQSLSQTFIHIIFSTKHRRPFITPDVEGELHALIASICNSLHCPAKRVGGYLDHIHILCLLSKNISIAHLLKEVKQNSSILLKKHHPNLKDFYWQGGYAVFSVEQRNLDIVIDYITTQREHHAIRTFQTELRDILNQNNMAFDERYIWD